jgi:predicted membrane chloride channel (bestrophin family)
MARLLARNTPEARGRNTANSSLLVTLNLQRNLNMKRILAAVSFAVLATPAFAAQISAPYEDTQNDRALPNVQTTGERGTTSRSNEGKSNSSEANPWKNDYNFIAPAL